MSKVRIEAYVSVPPCTGMVFLNRMLDEINERYPDRVEVVIHRGVTPALEEQQFSAMPALVIGGLIRFIGVVPDRETLALALRKCGVIVSL
ncbi:hypothetical protein SAMN02745218_01562 [Desulfofundulus australicus DSM 11792]|uniref:Thioredoxin domain-containing protein n=1 Tax=Desulfofundulus australicus DSM 11792 TaxID=1121425 RepID=A0A1M4ZBA0_9FIRM|nr:hypothetical protein [Desulfofundulus australicus]SHF15087.1 hypothetical protein SAMN02745218_01562 [Desulfofundulus australicus DSM 11792]